MSGKDAPRPSQTLAENSLTRTLNPDADAIADAVNDFNTIGQRKLLIKPASLFSAAKVASLGHTAATLPYPTLMREASLVVEAARVSLATTIAETAAGPALDALKTTVSDVSLYSSGPIPLLRGTLCKWENVLNWRCSSDSFISVTLNSIAASLVATQFIEFSFSDCSFMSSSTSSKADPSPVRVTRNQNAHHSLELAPRRRRPILDLQRPQHPRRSRLHAQRELRQHGRRLPHADPALRHQHGAPSHGPPRNRDLPAVRLGLCIRGARGCGDACQRCG